MRCSALFYFVVQIFAAQVWQTNYLHGLALLAIATTCAVALPRIAPNKDRQLDFFAADIVDAIPKDDIASMERPLFALKPGDHTVRRYNRDGLSIEVQPSIKGLATIHDKDIWIYCISQLVESMNRGRQDTCRVVRFTAYDFLKATNRGTSGRSYERFGAALERLRGTSIVTNRHSRKA